MLDMGFLGEIKRIMRHVPKQRQTLLFSATVDEAILKHVAPWLNEPKRIGVDAPNTAVKVQQTFYAVDDDKKHALIAYMIGKNNWQQVLVFTRTKHYADTLAKELNKDGLATLAIHGDKSQGARNKALEQFKDGQTGSWSRPMSRHEELISQRSIMLLMLNCLLLLRTIFTA